MIMKTKTEQLDELFHKWHSEQKKSDFKNRDHFSEDGLIKTDDENCVVLLDVYKRQRLPWFLKSRMKCIALPSPIRERSTAVGHFPPR